MKFCILLFVVGCSIAPSSQLQATGGENLVRTRAIAIISRHSDVTPEGASAASAYISRCPPLLLVSPLPDSVPSPSSLSLNKPQSLSPVLVSQQAHIVTVVEVRGLRSSPRPSLIHRIQARPAVLCTLPPRKPRNASSSFSSTSGRHVVLGSLAAMPGKRKSATKKPAPTVRSIVRNVGRGAAERPAGGGSGSTRPTGSGTGRSRHVSARIGSDRLSRPEPDAHWPTGLPGRLQSNDQ